MVFFLPFPSPPPIFFSGRVHYLSMVWYLSMVSRVWRLRKGYRLGHTPMGFLGTKQVSSPNTPSFVQYCFTSTETVGLLETGSPGWPPRLSHGSWALPPPPPPDCPPHKYTHTGQWVTSLSWACLHLVGHILYDTYYWSKINKLPNIYTVGKTAMLLLLTHLPLHH